MGESPIKNKSRKIKKSKRNVEVDTDTSTDNEKFKNLKITKAANTSSELDRSFKKTETSALKSSLDYAPIKNRKIKLKKKALNDTADVSALLALESSQEGASKDESVGDVMKELDDFINE